jgi:hypothetical protein
MVTTTNLPGPREGCYLHCVRCNEGLYYVRPERGMPHHFECRWCGQKHAAWETGWEPYQPAPSADSR